MQKLVIRWYMLWLDEQKRNCYDFVELIRILCIPDNDIQTYIQAGTVSTGISPHLYLIFTKHWLNQDFFSERDCRRNFKNVRYFPKGFFQSGNFQRIFSKVATSQEYFPKWQLPKSVLAAALGPLADPSRSTRPSISAWGASEALT